MKTTAFVLLFVGLLWPMSLNFAPMNVCHAEPQDERHAADVNDAPRISVGKGGAKSEGTAAAPSPRYRFVHTSMSIDITLLAYAADAETAQLAAGAAFARIDELDGILSDYKPQSELRRLCDSAGTGRFVPVSKDLWNVLRRAAQISAFTDGAFDVTAAPAIRLWRRSRTSMAIPLPTRMAAALELVGWQKMEFDESNHSIRLEKSGMRLDVGGIAKGYIVAEALQTLASHGVTSALLAAGGDVGVSDPPPGKPGWILGVAPLTPEQIANQRHTSRGEISAEESAEERSETNSRAESAEELDWEDEVSARPIVAEERPSHYLVVSNCFAATSGDAFQYVVINGVRYSHILDPRSGLAVTTPCSVSLIGSDAVATDALATTMNVLGPKVGVQLLDRYNEDRPQKDRIAAHFLWTTMDPDGTPEVHHLHNDEWTKRD